MNSLTTRCTRRWAAGSAWTSSTLSPTSGERGRYADKTMSHRRVRAGLAIIGLMAGLSCIRNVARDQPKGVCEVHHVPLTTSIIPLNYGLPPALSDTYREAY